MDFDGDFGQIHTWAFFSPSFGSYEGSYRCPQQFMKLAPEAGFEPAKGSLSVRAVPSLIVTLVSVKVTR
jgi:hypothetical protein